MASFNYEQAEHYGQQSNGSFFSLKNDRDVARVRFMYNGMEDIEGVAVHEVEIDGKRRYVNCLREYNSPIDDCPFCKAHYKVIPKVFVQLYDIDADEVKIWDRGKTFFQKISSICSRYSPLVSYEFEIERQGAKGDIHTKYEIFPVGEKSDTRLEDLPEAPTIIGGLVLDKSADDMEYYLDNGCFASEEEPAQRNGGRASSNNQSEPVRRRTPAGASRRDVY